MTFVRIFVLFFFKIVAGLPRKPTLAGREDVSHFCIPSLVLKGRRPRLSCVPDAAAQSLQVRLDQAGAIVDTSGSAAPLSRV